MIEPMKKVTIATSVSDREDALRVLQDLTLLHLADTGPDQTPETLRRQSDLLHAALALIPEPASTKPGEVGFAGADELAERILENRLQHETTTQARIECQRELAVLEEIGLSDPKEVEALASEGIHLHLIEQQTEDRIRRISVILSDDELGTLPGRKLDLPKRSDTALRMTIRELDLDLQELDAEFEFLSTGAQVIRQGMVENRNAREFARAVDALSRHGEIATLAGYCPVARLGDLQRAAEAQGWALLVADPAAEDPTPTQLRHGRLSRWFQPVMDFVGVVPGYHEFHAHAFFLIFFTVFFALIVGDAGYGLLMLLTTLILGRRISTIPRPAIALSTVLATATIIWGALTGVWFGVESLSRAPVLGSLVAPGLQGYAADNEANMIALCLVLGIGHLVLARLWRAIAKPDRRWGEAGWALLVVAAGVAAFKLLLGAGQWNHCVIAAVGGLTLVALFGESDGPLAGLKALPLSLLQGITGFSDTVSYVRLFAVGLATREVATAFNHMAAQAGSGTLLGVVLFAIIVVLGHGVNLLLAAMGVLVHGLRLNLLECSRHLGVNWSGIPYAPFRRWPGVIEPSPQSSTKGTS